MGFDIFRGFNKGVKMATLTKQEVAEYLGVSVRAVDYLRQNEGLPCLKMGRLVRFPSQKLEEWVNQHTQTGGVPSLSTEKQAEYRKPAAPSL